MDDLATLWSEQYEYRKQKPNQRPWIDPLQRGPVVPGWVYQFAKSEPGYDCCPERNSEKNCNAFRNGRVRSTHRTIGMTNDLDE